MKINVFYIYPDIVIKTATTAASVLCNQTKTLTQLRTIRVRENYKRDPILKCKTKISPF